MSYIEMNTTLLMYIVFGFFQSTILKEDVPGFIFESNRGTKHSFTAETSLGAEFSTGWGGKKSKKFKSKTEEIKTKVNNHFFYFWWYRNNGPHFYVDKIIQLKM